MKYGENHAVRSIRHSEKQSAARTIGVAGFSRRPLTNGAAITVKRHMAAIARGRSIV